MAFIKDTVRQLPANVVAQTVVQFFLSAATSAGAVMYAIWQDAPMWALPPVAALVFAAIYWIAVTWTNRRQRLSETQKLTDAATNEATTPPSGDTASFADTVSDHPTFEPKGFDLSTIEFSEKQLTQDRILIVTMRCFNATGRDIDIIDVGGPVRLWLDGDEKAGTNAHPRLKREEHPSKNLKTLCSFRMSFELLLSQATVDAIMSLSDDSTLHMRLGELKIDFAPSDSREAVSTVSLFQWHTLKLTRRQHLWVCGRIVNMVGTAKVKVNKR